MNSKKQLVFHKQWCQFHKERLKVTTDLNGKLEILLTYTTIKACNKSHNTSS